MEWEALAERAVRREAIDREEALAVLEVPLSELMALLAATYQVRHHFFGNRVKLNYLVNIKSGMCPEDCFYCSQSRISEAPIDRYPLLAPQEILAQANRAVAVKARRLCLVASGRGPSDQDIEQVEESVRLVKQTFPDLEVCCCLGLLSGAHGERLKAAGVYAYNHNLNTSEDRYAEICTTHTYQDRVNTVGQVKLAGLSPCSGCLFGMGEQNADIVRVAFALRDLQVDSIPVNFLIHIPGTPLAGHNDLTPQRCLAILCLFRLVNPSAELRIAGGREVHLRSLQPLGLFVANSIFIGDYLTTKGQPPETDLRMIRDLGFEIEGTPDGIASSTAQLVVELKGSRRNVE
ncbi:MAG: biotin synthase BioB [Elusimicrobia bacterium]|nr:biotin synthase BioB [Elusimicrobiota bacterium]